MSVASGGRRPPLFFLDDDPTGTQAVRDVPVLLRWEPGAIERALAGGPAAVHLMTNARALPAADAEALTAQAARAALAAAPDAELVLRGDSTLRGHVLEEYRAVRDALGSGRPPVLLLVPALPAAGRVTRGGVHLLVRDGEPVPLHETEYAGDGDFAYRSARLLDWAGDRSAGFFAPERGTELPLARLRDGRGADALAQALLEAWSSDGPAACAPDAETVDDLHTIAAGLREAQRRGAEVIVRCAPTFAGVLAGTLADGLVPPPRADGGVLVVCGSYVPNTGRQLADLAERRGAGPIELDPLALAAGGATADSAVRAAAVAAGKALSEHGLAVVATARERPPSTRSLEAGMRIARALASVVPAVEPPPGVLLAKGGITSAVTLEAGVGATAARVVGPLLPGVALWEAQWARGALNYVVVPGNVGGPTLLTDLVDLLLGGSGC